MGTGKLTFGKLWMIAYRDLGRNRRRSLLTLIAVALGLGLLILTAGLIDGAVAGSIANNIRLQTGHVQIRAESYEEDKSSLAYEDLVENAHSLAQQVQALPQVRAAAPMLWASGILQMRDETVGVRVFGIDTLANTSAPIRESIVAGQFLTPDDRGGLLIGQRLANSLGIQVNDQVSLLINTANEQSDEAPFTVRGLYATGVPTYDDVTIFLPLDKAQAFTHTEGRASTIMIQLHDKESAAVVAASLSAPQFKVLTWQDMNQMILQAVETSMGIMYLMYLIVLGVVAVVIANTLLMSVFERTREMGILAALGMKKRQILLMFLLEAATLGLIGVLLGNLLGSLGVWYLAVEGWHIGEVANVASEAMAYGETIYAQFAPQDMFNLSIAAMVIILLASLYPAWLAARMEPVEALRAL